MHGNTENTQKKEEHPVAIYEDIQIDFWGKRAYEWFSTDEAEGSSLSQYYIIVKKKEKLIKIKWSRALNSHGEKLNR